MNKKKYGGGAAERGERGGSGGGGYHRGGGGQARSPAGYGRGGRGGGPGDGPHHKGDRDRSERGGGAHSGGGGGGPGGLGGEDGVAAKGVYKNKQFTFATSAVVGCVMRVETADGKTFEGVFVTWSPGMDVVLEQVHEVADAAADKPGKNNVDPGMVKDKMIFGPQQYVSLHSVDVDMDFATKEGFTDTEISRGVASERNGEMRELEKWEPEGEDDMGVDLDLDGGNENGWKAEDMFRENKARYNVTSTYKSNLEGYTTQLNKDTDSEEYREREAHAARIARQIEGDGGNRQAIELENGDEEEAFSAVMRQDSREDRGGRHHGRDYHDGGSRGRHQQHEDMPSGGGSKYVPPAKRQNSRGEGRGGHHQGVDGRPIPPPGQGQGTPRYQQQRNTPPPSMGGPGGHHYSHRDRDHQQLPPHDEHGRGGSRGGPQDHRSPYGDRRSSREGSGGGYDGPPPRHHRDGPPPGRGGYHGGPSPAGGKHPMQVSTQRQHNQDHRISPTATNEERKKESPQPSPPGRPGRPGKSREEHINELKDFQKNLVLASGPGGEQQQQQQLDAKKDDVPTASAVVSTDAPGASSSPPTSTAASTGTPTTPAPQATSTSSVSSTTAALAAKSTLNPNAKEFSLNPNAKAFVPSSAARQSHSVTPPARPQTPGTPGGPLQGMPPQSIAAMASMAAHMYSGAAAAGFPVMPPGAAGQPMVQYVTGSGAVVSPQNVVPNSMPLTTVVSMAGGNAAGLQQPRFRGGQMAPPRGALPSELPSPMHATGQPLLAPPMVQGGAPQHGAPSNIAGNFVVQPTMMINRLPMANANLQQAHAAALLSQQQQQSGGHDAGSAGPASLPAGAHWQASAPPGVQVPNQQQQPQQQMPSGVPLTPTPPTGSMAGPPPPAPGHPPHTSASPGPQQLMYGMHQAAAAAAAAGGPSANAPGGGGAATGQPPPGPPPTGQPQSLPPNFPPYAGGMVMTFPPGASPAAGMNSPAAAAMSYQHMATPAGVVPIAQLQHYMAQSQAGVPPGQVPPPMMIPTAPPPQQSNGNSGGGAPSN